MDVARQAALNSPIHLKKPKKKLSEILGMDIKGLTVEKVLIDPGADIQKEIYLAITNDRASGKPLIIASAEGGMDIEQLAEERPEAIVRQHIDPLFGLHSYQANAVASKMNMPREQWRAFRQDFAVNFISAMQPVMPNLQRLIRLWCKSDGSILSS